MSTAGATKCPVFILRAGVKYFGSVNLGPSTPLWKQVPAGAGQPTLRGLAHGWIPRLPHGTG